MKPTNDDIVEISRALALWAHIMDDQELDRLGECLTEDAIWDGSVSASTRSSGWTRSRPS